MSPRRLFWFALGSASLALGAIGAVLPLIPTTPLVILAAFCFGKSFPVLQTWLENTETFGPAIADWRQNGAISVRVKWISVTMMVAALLLSVTMGLPLYVLLIQAICICGAAAFVLTLPSQ